MTIREQELVRNLATGFKSRVIYTDLYFQHYQGSKTDELLRQLAKQAGKTRGQWLTEHGFQWKETGYLEPDMRLHKAASLNQEQTAYSIAHSAFCTYSLAGEYVPSQSERSLLYQSAEESVRRMIDEEPLQKRNAIVLVFETIQLLKDWNRIGIRGTDTFWRYIYRQYGFNAEGRPEAEQQLYDGFRKAITFTLSHYKRFLAPKETTQQFYTTLLLHAMAPRQSIEELFNNLFDFYAKYLDFQYTEEDISFKVYTREMRARWDSQIQKNENFQFRSGSVLAGIQTLFRERPGYMAVLCDTIVRKMDLILRGEERGELFPERNYWDRLLLDWFGKKSSAERTRIQDTRRSKQVEFVATSKERIHVQFTLENETVGLAFPRIRLPRVEVRNPVVRVYQGSSLLFEDTLSVTRSKDDLCLTTQSRFLTLETANYDGTSPLNLRVEIEYGNETLYRSGEKLNRSYLLFDGEGRERVQKAGIVWLFTDSTRNVDFSGESGVYLCPHPGQLFRVNLGEVTSITVDGGEVFADERTTSRFRHHTSINRTGIAGTVSDGRQCDIFPGSFALTLYLPDGENPVRYRISADGVTLRTQELHRQEANAGGFTVNAPDNPAAVHCVRVTDLVSNLIRYEYRYMILPGCAVQLDRRLYRENLDEAEIQFNWDEYSGSFRVPVPSFGEKACLSIPGLELEIEVSLPTVRCMFMGASAFAAPETMWHEVIPHDEFVTVDLPDGWTANLKLGNRQVPADQTGRRFELGNYLRSGIIFGDREPLVLFVGNDHGYAESYAITNIAFTPSFLCCPLEVRDGKLLWQAEGNYIGAPDARFSVTCVFPDGEERQFEIGCGDELLQDSELPEGEYRCKVSLKLRSVFARGPAKILFQDRFFSGDPLMFAYAGRKIHIGDAQCWDFDRDKLKLVSMRPGCGILRNLKYCGTTIAAGESVPAPQYTATLYFTDRYGELHPFSFRASRDYEQINPVDIWIINEHLLILHDANQDGLYIDNYYSTIVNRKPDSYLSRAEQKMRLETPDYFHYQVQEE